MALYDDLEKQVEEIFATEWQINNSSLIPLAEHVKLGNHALKLDATVLYADLAESTNLVDSEDPLFAAEIYKAYLHCASKIIKSLGGVITSFDGDRIMGVFIKNNKSTRAVRCGLQINHAVTEIINASVARQYPQNSYSVKHSVGIDSCELIIARTGVRGSNDLVWVGRAANYAAKLCTLREHPYNTFITDEVYLELDMSAVYTENETNMWERYLWKEKDIFVYRSEWTWKI